MLISIRRIVLPLLVALFLGLAGSASAVVKFYSADKDNGTPGDNFRTSINVCPPFALTPGVVEGFHRLNDDGLGTVTLEFFENDNSTLTDLDAEQLTPIFGPGAFIFIDNTSTINISGPHVSTTSGVGAHGPSNSAPGGSVEWGLVSGFVITGQAFCISSPVGICNQAGFIHGQTIPRTLPSSTYDLGTWAFDAEGDFEQVTGYLTRTTNGGLSNNGTQVRGAFHGAALPVLPIAGFGALALGLGVVGARALTGRR